MYLFRWKYMGIIHIQTALARQVSVVVFAVSKQSCAENKKAKDSWQRSRLLLSTNLNWVQHRNSYRRPHISHQKLWLWFLIPQGQPRSNLMVRSKSPWLLSRKSSLASNLVSVTIFKIFWIKGLWPLNLTSQAKWSPWALYIISVGSNIVTLAVLDIFHVKKYDLDFWPLKSDGANRKP